MGGWWVGEGGLTLALPPLLVASRHPAHRRRCYWVTLWNVGHSAMVFAFLPQLYDLAPPGSTCSSTASAEGLLPAAAAASSAAPSLAGQLAWLLWHSQALIMALNAAAPLVNTFRFFLQVGVLRVSGAVVVYWIGGADVGVTGWSPVEQHELLAAGSSPSDPLSDTHPLHPTPPQPRSDVTLHRANCSS